MWKKFSHQQPPENEDRAAKTNATDEYHTSEEKKIKTAFHREKTT